MCSTVVVRRRQGSARSSGLHPPFRPPHSSGPARALVCVRADSGPDPTRTVTTASCPPTRQETSTGMSEVPGPVWVPEAEPPGVPKAEPSCVAEAEPLGRARARTEAARPHGGLPGRRPARASAAESAARSASCRASERLMTPQAPVSSAPRRPPPPQHEHGPDDGARPLPRSGQARGPAIDEKHGTAWSCLQRSGQTGGPAATALPAGPDAARLSAGHISRPFRSSALPSSCPSSSPPSQAPRPRPGPGRKREGSGSYLSRPDRRG